MKNLALVIVLAVIAIGAILEFRYQVIVDSPIVAKVDRLTGDVWIVNSGIWRKVQTPGAEKREDEKTLSSHKERQGR